MAAMVVSYNSINVSWNAVGNASGYQLYRATSPDGTYSLIKGTTSTSYTNTGLSTGKTYYYKIRAYRTVSGSKVYSDYSDIVSATPVLSPVSGVAAVAYYPTSIRISWSGVPGRSRYEVWRACSASGAFSLVKTTTGTSWKDTTRTPFVTYYYYITAYRTVSGRKVYSPNASETVSATPVLGDVTGVTAGSYSASSIKVKWSSVTGASGYEVYRADAPDGAYTLIKSTSSRSFIDTGRIPNQTYYYQVVAYRKVGSDRIRSASSTVSAASVFGSVKNPRALRSGATKIRITWSAVPERTGYEIYRAETADGAYTYIGSTTRTYYNDSVLVAGQTYYYMIRAYRTVNGARYYSGYSGVVSATP
jgi:fibronectin type 3 domain-containing protein